MRYLQNVYYEIYDPEIDEGTYFYYQAAGRSFKVEILADAFEDGEDRKPKSAYLLHTNLIVLVYSIASLESFEYIKKTLEYIKFVLKSVSLQPSYLLCATQCDKEEERKVSQNEAFLFAESLETRFFEVSSKTNINIKDLFEEIVVRAYVQKYGSFPPKIEKKVNKKGCLIS
ncbi:hypothetical protein EIN_412690 [Entamoeba invadens IP1]|uniref:Uncharacterized protein n=1 Tax=Entamoeba invadens IP1 TaxID=370355 RepID=L7FJM5_ENTIV|nr:hypothetical protein EIN_412690 [Entamoeba invadens IP1]ELP84056.1 hypothetical protein EIN_412690 [Entamoeba invadens IP1]|eukprot:XP_004183402.1 hypothetical protein EIN_412690 [Entamoeba invadens IP1]